MWIQTAQEFRLPHSPSSQPPSLPQASSVGLLAVIPFSCRALGGKIGEQLLQSLLGDRYLWRHRGSCNNVKSVFSSEWGGPACQTQPASRCLSWLSREGIRREGGHSAEQAGLALAREVAPNIENVCRRSWRSLLRPQLRTLGPLQCCSWR